MPFFFRAYTNGQNFCCCYSECVALQDPYCAWDKINGKCKSYGAPRWNDDSVFYQNVQTGQHAACPSGRMSPKDANAGEQKGYRDIEFDGMRHREQNGGEVINIMQEKDFNGNGKWLWCVRRSPCDSFE